MDFFHETQQHLSTALSAAVQLYSMELQQQGGPTDADVKACKKAGLLLAEKGDVLMFRGKKAGETAQVFNTLARSIAVLSYCPGGVTTFGQHWETTT